MKKCPMCGQDVEDHASECPNCGCPIADTSGFSLKGGNNSAPRKGSSNPMGRTISTGSGLTDILNEGEEDFSVGGSIPVSLSKNETEDLNIKPKSNVGGTVFKLLFIVAIGFGIYYLLNTYVFSNKKAYSPEEALEFYVKAVNEDDVDYMRGILPSYVENRDQVAQEYLDNISVLHIDSYTIDSKEDFADIEISELQDAIKLQTTLTSRIASAVRMKVTFHVDVDGDSEKLKNGDKLDLTMNLEFIEINTKWYLQTTSYDNIDYN